MLSLVPMLHRDLASLNNNTLNKTKMKFGKRTMKRGAVVFLAAFFVLASVNSGMFNTQAAEAVPGKEDMKKLFKPVKERTPGNRKIGEKSRESLSKKSDYVSDEVLVKFRKEKIDLQGFLETKGGVNKIEGSFQAKAIAGFASKYGMEKKSQILKSNTVVMKIKDGETVDSKIKKLKQDPSVELAQPNFKYHPTAINPVNDTLYTNQWGLNNTGQTITVGDTDYESTADADIDAPEAWAVSEGDNSIIAAVLDTGVAYDHPDLASNMWDGSGSCNDENGDAIGGGCPNHGWDYDNGDNNPAPGDSIDYYYYSHGTHVAGIIAARDNTEGIVGVAPHTQIMAVKVAGLTTDILVEGIAFAQNNGAKVINGSFGGSEEDEILKEAIEDFDGLYVASAGNDGEDNDSLPMYPCADDPENIICVAATDQNDELTGWSNYGATTVDVGAPGENIQSTIAESGVSEYFEGTANGSIPSGFTQTGGAGHEWQVGSAQADFANDELWRKVLFSDSSFPYADNANTTFGNTTAYDLSSSTNADITFYTACDTESDPRSATWKDYMALEFSDDGNSFYEVARWDKDTLAALRGSGPGIGYSDAIYETGIPSHYLTANFKFRFRWVTNGSNNNYGGCMIDDLLIRGYKSDGNATLYDFYDGTSMAAPMVTGLASLLWETDGNLTPQEVKNAVVHTGDSLDTLDGATVSGKRINAYKALTKKQLTAFSFDGLAPAVAGTVNETSHTVTLRVPAGTDVTNLEPSVTYAGASLSPASGEAQDFTDPVTYTVTAVNGTTQNYTVRAVYEPKITGFSFGALSPTVSATIDDDGGTISATLPYGTDLTALVPTIEHTGSSISPASDTAQDFTNPVTYTVTAADSSTKTYSVTIADKATPFNGAVLSVNGSDTSQGSVITVNNPLVSITFGSADEAVRYRFSHNRRFRGAQWHNYAGSISLKLKKTKRKQTLYFQLRDANGYKSSSYKRVFKYIKS